MFLNFSIYLLFIYLFSPYFSYRYHLFLSHIFKASTNTIQQLSSKPARRCRVLFFFFLDSRWLGTDLGRFVLNRANLGRLGPYWPQPPTPAPNRPIQAEIKNKKKRSAKRTVWTKTLYLSISVHFSSSDFNSLTLCLSGPCAPHLHTTASPIFHTISLSTHSHTHIISLSRVSTLNSLTLCSLSPLRYQSQAFNLSFA